MPKAIAEAPDIEDHSFLYYWAYTDLMTCRNFENGEIPWTAIKIFADEYGLDEEQRDILFEVTRSVDIWYLKEIEKRAEKKNGKEKPKRRSSGTRKKNQPVGQRG